MVRPATIGSIALACTALLLAATTPASSEASPFVQQAKIQGNGGAFGGAESNSVALSADGNTALVGTPEEEGDEGGSVWVLTRSGSSWAVQSKLKMPNTGAAWVFTRSGTRWTQQQKLTGGDEVGGARFGRSVALSSSGATALIGSPEDNVKLGAAWVFTDPEPYAPLETPPYGSSTTPAAGGPAGGTGTAPIVANGSAPTGGTVTAPVISDLSQSHRDWRAGKALAKLSRNQGPAPVGTTFSFALNEAANVRLAFTKHLLGREINGMCEIEPRGRRGSVCKRTIAKGALTLAASVGENKLLFQGRVTDSQELGPGSYTVAITATNTAGHSVTHSLDFTIVAH